MIKLLLLLLFISHLVEPHAHNHNHNHHRKLHDHSTSKECRRRYYPIPSSPHRPKGNEDSFVCVCTEDFCDEVEPVGELADNGLVYYTSSAASDRLKKRSTTFSSPSSNYEEQTVTVRVDGSISYQTVLGFGGAFTDAAGINLNSLSEKTRQRLLAAYFGPGPTSIGYTLGRVPIASCDFSTHEYSYLEKQDFKADSFKLAQEDGDYKVLYILAAMNLTGPNNLRLFGSPWSAPAWMKTNNAMKGGGQLKGAFNGQYYETYAIYFRKFLEAYAKEGVNFWAVTIQNEPSSGLDKYYPWQTMYMSSVMQRDFAQKLLRPAIDASPLEVVKKVKIIAHDDQRSGVFEAANDIYAGEPSNYSAIDGLGVHWYSRSSFDSLTKAHNVNPNKFILSTEACNGAGAIEHVPLLGDWGRANDYAWDILNNLANWVVGWTDWNMALDLEGGPNWVNNFVDAPIIVNKSADEFYKQPMYYALGHFR